MLALPFWNMVAKYRIPLKIITLNESSSIGMHIKKKRLELKLRQVDVASILNTTEDSVRFWETDRAKPQINFAPGIIKFLAYNPYPVEPNTMGGRIKHYRILHGLSHKKMGRIIGVGCGDN